MKFKRHNYESYIEKKFGKWTVISYNRRENNPRIHFNCICKYGYESNIQARAILDGSSKSCKYCAPLKHGHNRTASSKPTSTYRTWQGMHTRCNNPLNHDYSNYGGRGIKVCERWKSFENFLSDMGEKPPNLTLDRINNDGDYEPLNCRWTTRSVQNSNQRKRLCKKGASKLIIEGDIPLYSLN